jgi:hypothetical protein
LSFPYLIDFARLSVIGWRFFIDSGAFSWLIHHRAHKEGGEMLLQLLSKLFFGRFPVSHSFCAVFLALWFAYVTENSGPSLLLDWFS